jgi:hypothetical protein
MTYELVAAVAQGTLTNFAWSAFNWLAKKALPLWYSIRRWWGGEAGKKRVWDAYKMTRNAIMSQERNDSVRQYLIADLRAECRLNYPAYKSLWN